MVQSHSFDPKIEIRDHRVEDDSSKKKIAIIGMSSRLPNAKNVMEFWENLENGIDCITNLPESRMNDVKAFLSFTQTPIEGVSFYNAGYLKEIDKFDYNFFKLSPKEANLMDPNQRMFLEVAWQAIEDAGYGGSRLSGSKTGVFIGCNDDNQYKDFVKAVDPASYVMAIPGNIRSFIASRIAYILDLKGPSILVDTACSSSLVAIHLACQAIRNGDCEQALVGASRLYTLPFVLSYQEKMGIEASDFKTKTFDDDSDGTVAGEGVIAFLLKPLNKALQDGDNIHAVILGSAINQDGNSNSITAPNVLAQEEVIVNSWDNAKIDPTTITYIEAHGTGTKLGDPVELSGIQRAFRRYTNMAQFCAIGSVKTNIGHLDNAAGAAGLLKLILSLKNKKLPPSLHFKRPNRHIDFEDSPVYVNNILTEWDTCNLPRRCGISSFGMSGTNCHMVLEEAPILERGMINKVRKRVFTLSAKTETAFRALISEYIKFFSIQKDLIFEDICYTSNIGRGHYKYRIAIIAESIAEIVYELFELSNKSTFDKYVINPNTLDETTNSNGVTYEKIINNINNKEYENSLIQLCDIYSRGVSVDWSKLYIDKSMRITSLPVYPFERKRCWLDINIELNESHNFSEKWRFKNRHENNLKDIEFEIESELMEPKLILDNLECQYYRTRWDKLDINRCLDFKYKRTIVLFKYKKGIGNDISLRLKSENNKVIEVSLDSEYKKLNEFRYEISNCEQDFVRLFNEINCNDFLLIHLTSIGLKNSVKNINELENNLEMGVLSLFRLSKALQNNKKMEKVDIIVLSEYAYKVTSKQNKVIPENAALYGLSRVIGMEDSRISCRTIDVDEETSIDILLNEIKSESDDYLISYRNEERYIETLDKVDVNLARTNEQFSVRDNGVYIITGGSGFIALKMAMYLASKNKVTIAMMSRSDFPNREEWDKIIVNSENKELCKKLLAIKEIENSGSIIEFHKVDVSIQNELRNTILVLQKKYGVINGIIHSAAIGVGKTGIIMAKKNEEEFRQVLLPKIQGTWLLNHLTSHLQLDFFVMFSSVITLTGGIGAGDYVAANSYQDSFSEYLNLGGKGALTINWPTWKESLNTNEYDTKILEKGQLFNIIKTEDALALFENVLNKKLERIILGRLNLNSKLSSSSKINQLRLIKEDDVNSDIKTNKAVILKGRENNEYSEYERKCAKVWGEVLGLNEIDIKDDYFELGGNSIIALKIVNKLRDEMSVKIEISDILKFYTIERLGAFLSNNNQLNNNVQTCYSKNSNMKKEFYPLSSAQLRIFILSLFEDIGTSYNTPFAMLIQGKLDLDIFEKALETLVNRHITFRTYFELQDGVPVQKVVDKIDLKIEYLHIEESRVNEAIESFVRPFNLNQAPLLRVKIIKIYEDKFIFLLDIHHIISDGLSMDIFINDFKQLYEGNILENLTTDYLDFVDWENSRLMSDDLIKQETYWLEKFKGDIPILNLTQNSHKNENEYESYEGDYISFDIGQDLVHEIIKIATETGTTLYMVLLAAYYILLSKYTNQTDIIVGTPITQRKQKRFENIIGMFVSTLALRNFPQSTKRFNDFLEEVKQSVIEAFENQDYPLEKIVSKLKIDRNNSDNPLFQTMFLLQDSKNMNTEISGLVISPIKINNKSSKFLLSLEAVEYVDNIRFTLEYRIKLFSKETINRLVSDYKMILRIIAQRKNLKISNFDLLNKDQLLLKQNINIDFNFD